MTLPKPTRGYPILLDVAERCCVIVGGGRVAERKANGLLAAGAHVTVITPALTDGLALRFARGEIAVECQPYATGMLTRLHPLLVFAATNDPAVNQQVVEDARRLGALADAVEPDGERDFSTMAAIRRGAITVGISTDGASPMLTKHLRERIEALIGAEYQTLATWLDEARQQVRAGVDEEADRRDVWREVLASPILDLLRVGDELTARTVFDAILAKAMA